MSAVYALVRQSPDWASLDEGYFAEMRRFARLIGRPEDQPERGVRLWNAVAPVSFFHARAALKLIAEARLDALPFPRASLADLPALPADAWVVPVDDDDWLSPALADALAGLDAELAVWRSLVLRDDLQQRPMDGICYSNNYAVRAGALARLDADPAVAIQHWAADAAGRDGRVTRADLDLPLSIVLRHPASTLVLEQVLASADPPVELRARLDRFYQAAETARPSADPWLVPGLAALSGLFGLMSA